MEIVFIGLLLKMDLIKVTGIIANINSVKIFLRRMKLMRPRDIAFYAASKDLINIKQ